MSMNMYARQAVTPMYVHRYRQQNCAIGGATSTTKKPMPTTAQARPCHCHLLGRAAADPPAAPARGPDTQPARRVEALRLGRSEHRRQLRPLGPLPPAQYIARPRRLRSAGPAPTARWRWPSSSSGWRNSHRRQKSVTSLSTPQGSGNAAPRSTPRSRALVRDLARR